MPRDPFPVASCRFKLFIDGEVIGSFNEVSGLAVEMTVEELIEGGENQRSHFLPGRLRWPNLIFRRGLVQNDLFFSWLTGCANLGSMPAGAKITGKTGVVQLLAPDFTVARAWSFVDAIPVKWTGPDFSVGSKDIANESLEVCHGGFRSGS